MLELKTFGGLRLEVGGTRRTRVVERPKHLACLALLATAGTRGVSRDKLIAYLWPETDAAHSHHLLKQACYDMRRDLRRPELILGRDVLQLNPAAMTSDAQRFTAAVEADDLARAVAEYAGPFLDGFYLNGCAEFDRWVEAERARAAQKVTGALEKLAKAAAARGDAAAAAEWWGRLAEHDPFSSQAVLARMTFLAAAGERARALQVGRRYVELVRRELDAAPASAVRKFLELLRHETGETMR